MRQTALQTVYQLAKKDPRVVFVGSDLGSGTLKEMRNEFPERFYMEGISEQHILGFAAGLAKEGYLPYLNTIATFFARRAYEQIAIDVALHNLPVRILASGGGMVYAPLGPTHTAIEDLSLMLSIPNLKVFAPADANEMRNLLEASIGDSSPWYIRFGKGGEAKVTAEVQDKPWTPKIFGASKPKYTVITTGVTLHPALGVLNQYPELELAVIHIPFLNEIRLELWKDRVLNSERILVVEEHVPRGGLFTQILHEFYKFNLSCRNFIHLSLPNNFSHKYGSQDDHFRYNGFDTEGIRSALLKEEFREKIKYGN